jgi:hypothetical protein
MARAPLASATAVVGSVAHSEIVEFRAVEDPPDGCAPSANSDVPRTSFVRAFVAMEEERSDGGDARRDRKLEHLKLDCDC